MLLQLGDSAQVVSVQQPAQVVSEQQPETPNLPYDPLVAGSAALLAILCTCECFNLAAGDVC